MIQRISRLCGHRVVLLLCVCGHVGSGSAFGYELADVLNAWEKRSDQVGSWRVLLEGDYTYRPPSNAVLRALNPPLIDAEKLSTEEWAQPAEWELWLSGHKDPRFFVRRNAPTMTGETGQLWRKNSRMAYDGTRVTSLDRWDGIDLHFAAIHGGEVAKRESQFSIEFKPVIMCFRALDVDVDGFRRDELRLTGRTGSKGHRNLPIIEISGRDGVEIWVNPHRGFTVAKYRTPRIEMEIDYIEHATGTWIPSEWTIVASSLYTVRVAAWDVNPKSLGSGFTIPFPPNTLIHDFRERPPQSSFVDERGRTREISSDEADSLFACSMVRIFPSAAREILARSREGNGP